MRSNSLATAPRIALGCRAVGASCENEEKSSEFQKLAVGWRWKRSVQPLKRPSGMILYSFAEASKNSGVLKSNYYRATAIVCVSKCVTEYRHVSYGGSLVESRETQTDDHDSAGIWDTEQSCCLTIGTIRTVRDNTICVAYLRFNTICRNFCVTLCGVTFASIVVASECSRCRKRSRRRDLGGRDASSGEVCFLNSSDLCVDFSKGGTSCACSVQCGSVGNSLAAEFIMARRSSGFFS